MNNLKKLRIERKLSQQELADLLHTTQQSVYKYEKGITSPNFDTLSHMADIFDTSVDYLIEHTSISRKIEPTEEWELNEDEQALLRKYRKLPRRLKELSQTIIDEFSNNRT